MPTVLLLFKTKLKISCHKEVKQRLHPLPVAVFVMMIPATTKSLPTAKWFTLSLMHAAISTVVPVIACARG